MMIAYKARKALRERLGFSGNFETALNSLKVQLALTY